jgi:hypothetical protein
MKEHNVTPAPWQSLASSKPIRAHPKSKEEEEAPNYKTQQQMMLSGQTR